MKSGCEIKEKLNEMTKKNRQRTFRALTNAAELIRGTIEGGVSPDEIGEEDEKGLEEFRKATDRAYRLIMTLAKKYN